MKSSCQTLTSIILADVDRAVSNIMHMGIAMRSREQREELHLEAEDLDEMINNARNDDERMELRIERLNVLMAVLDVENESLGRSKMLNSVIL